MSVGQQVAGQTVAGDELRHLVRSDVAAAVVPRDHREVAARDRILLELDRLEHPFDRHGGLMHVTGSAVIAGSRGTVLHRHKRLGRWMQPGGHLEPGESPAEAAQRESAEETGLVARHPDGEPQLLHVDVHRACDDHVHLDLRYLLLVDGDGDPAPGPGESTDVSWFSWDAALARSDESLRGALLAACSRP